MTTLQAINVESYAEQQRLETLRMHGSTRGPRGEFPFDARNHRFDQGALRVDLAREPLAHLRAHAVDPPRAVALLGGNHTARLQRLANETVVAFGVEFRIGQ